MLRAVTFHREIRTGSSLPLVVSAGDGEQYVLKPHGSGDGMLASAVEWLALGLGRLLGVPVLEPVVMEVGPGFAAQAEDPEIRELLERSPGMNLATRLVAAARVPGEAELAALDPGLRRDMLAFDLLLLNVDRHARNPNAILGAGGVCFLDFSSAMSLRGLLAGSAVPVAPFLGQLRRNPFYAADVDLGPFIRRMAQVPAEPLRELMASLPGPWLRDVAPVPELGACRQRVAAGLEALLADGGQLQERLEALRPVPLESDEDRRRRSEANKAEFRRRFGKL